MPIRFDLKQFLNPVFVETGTHRGGGIKLALKAGFSKIYTIEIEKDKLPYIQKNYGKHLASERVVMIIGDSAEQLPLLLEKLTGKCTFWLAAHLGGGGLPLTRELQAILKHTRNDHVIMIDDLRCFERWGIDIKEVKALLLQINPDYELRIMSGWQKLQDILVAIPPTK